MIKIILIIILLMGSTYSQSFIFEKYNLKDEVIDLKILESLSLDDLRLLRNSIYANYGYRFKAVDLKYIFHTHEEIQIPISINLQLTETERINLENIIAIEKSYNLKISKVWKNELGFDNDIRKINFDGTNDDLIRLCSNGSDYDFVTYTLENNKWNKRKSIRISHKPQSWTIGDLNKDDVDEIYYSNADSLFIIRYDMNQISTKFILLSEEVWQLLAADISNDGIDDLLIFSFKEKYDSDKPSIPLSLKIYQGSDDDLREIWESTNKIEFFHSNLQPPFELLFICKYFNDNRNHLFIRSEQSDVSPSNYITYYWENDELKKGSIFYFSNDSLFIDWSIWKEKFPFLVGTLDRIDYKKFYFGGIVLDKGFIWSYNLFEINNNKAVKRVILFTRNHPIDKEFVVLSGKFEDNQKSIIAISNDWIKMFK